MQDDDDDIPALGRNPERPPDMQTTPAGAEGGTTTPRATATGDALNLSPYLQSVHGGERGRGAGRAEEHVQILEEELEVSYRRIKELSDNMLRMERERVDSRLRELGRDSFREVREEDDRTSYHPYATSRIRAEQQSDVSGTVVVSSTPVGANLLGRADGAGARASVVGVTGAQASGSWRGNSLPNRDTTTSGMYVPGPMAPAGGNSLLGQGPTLSPRELGATGGGANTGASYGKFAVRATTRCTQTNGQ